MESHLERKFNAKVLLFGEYGIIKGSKGVAIPLDTHSGSLVQADSNQAVCQTLRLDEFYDYLIGSDLLTESMDLEKFKADIESGIYFKSNIPQGYGIGSSGALCAAIYSKYAVNFEHKDTYSIKELKALKDIMALMESFYHGSSSGLDCLISLIDLPLLIESRSSMTVIEKPNLSSFGKFYLFDTGHARITATFVHEFLSKYNEDSEYKNNINTFIDITNKIIEEFIQNKFSDFEKSFYDLSRQQYLHFSKMIPNSMKSIWLQGLETKEYYVKLCGAGGGGYFMIYSTSLDFHEKVKDSTDHIEVIYGHSI
jgi:mevalonate kinase